MPYIKVDLKKGRSKAETKQLIEEILKVTQECMSLPAHDRKLRLIEFDPEYLILDPNYEIIIEILLISGRTKDTKRKLYKNLVTNISNLLNIAPTSVFIILNEQPKENWGVRGGIPADEIDLGFKIEV